MAEYNHRKLYFLKLPKGFFARHDIKILEALPNGKEYSLFYLKLMLESLDHDGSLRYNELIPYNAEMLSAITNTNIDIVRIAVKTLEQMQLLEVLDDQTIFMRKVASMTIKTTEGAEKKAVQRALISNNDGQKADICPPEYRDKSIEIRVKKENNTSVIKESRSTFKPPTAEEVKQYCQERHNKVDTQRFLDFYTMKGWYVGKNKMKDWKAAVRTWEKDDKQKQSFEFKRERPSTERNYSPEDIKNICRDISNFDSIDL